MADFEQITTADADLKRVQANVAKKFREDDVPPQLPVQEVLSSGSIVSYTVKPSDAYLVVNARGGPIKIVLPVPARSTQVVHVLNAFTSNKVSVVQADGKPMGNGSAEIVLASEAAVTMVNSGKAWWLF